MRTGAGPNRTTLSHGCQTKEQWAIKPRQSLCVPRNASGHLPRKHPMTRKDFPHERAGLAEPPRHQTICPGAKRRRPSSARGESVLPALSGLGTRTVSFPTRRQVERWAKTSQAEAPPIGAHEHGKIRCTRRAAVDSPPPVSQVFANARRAMAAAGVSQASSAPIED